MPRNILILIGFIICGFLVTFWTDLPSNPIGMTEAVAEKEDTTNLQTLPDFEFTSIDGKTHKISEYRGKTVLLNFWATWCAPCVVEFPKLVELASSQDNTVLIALSSDIAIPAIEQFIEKQKPDIRKAIASPSVIVAKDNKGKITSDLFQTYRLPETIIIDKDGNMVKKIVGDTNWDSKEITSLLGSL